MAVTGRPTIYTPEFGDQILELMSQGLSLAAAAGELGVHRQRVYEWKERYPEFADTINLAMVKRQAWLERRLFNAEAGPVVTSTIFALKNAGHQDWRERQQIEHSGPEGGPIQNAEMIDITPEKRLAKLEMARRMIDEKIEELSGNEDQS